MRGGREDARDGALEAARHGSSETWLLDGEQKTRAAAAGAEGIGRGLVLACFVLAFCFIVRRETLERECALGLGLRVCACVYVFVLSFSCPLCFGVASPAARGGQGCTFCFFCLPAALPDARTFAH